MNAVSNKYQHTRLPLLRMCRLMRIALIPAICSFWYSTSPEVIITCCQTHVGLKIIFYSSVVCNEFYKMKSGNDYAILVSLLSSLSLDFAQFRGIL
jgi:hypothetical protein